MKEIWGEMVYEIYDIIEQVVDPKHTAILVIDMQNDHGPKGILAKNGRDISWVMAIVPSVKKVLEEARRRGMLIIFARVTRSKDGRTESPPRLRVFRRSAHGAWLPEYELEDTWGNEVLEELEPRPNEPQIVKYRSSAFHGTHVDFVLRNNKIETAVVMGLVTEGCVESTVRDLQSYGYYPVILRDCVTSSRRDLHDAALLVMGASYDVITSDELLQAWTKVPSSVAV